MSLPLTAQVLIVGGGPTGLCLALALHKHGCPDVVVVDGAAQGENTSRAAVIHAATIEALETIGCADLLVNEGRKISRTTVWLDPSPIETAYFTPLSRYTKFPFILAIPQHVTERIIGAVVQERGVQIYRPHKVVDMRPNQQDSNYTDVIFDNGHVLRTRCVVGADGSRSSVRQLANVGWADPTANGEPKDADAANMIIADVTLTQPPPVHADAVNLVVTPENSTLFILLPAQPYPDAGLAPDEPVYRIACGIPAHLGQPPHAPDTAYLQSLLDAWGPHIVVPSAPRVQIARTLWSSRFRTHSSIADRFLAHVPPPSGPEDLAGTDHAVDSDRSGGLVLLIGDAAHIHPPMGGQGMNLGIRDGIRLAPILTEYIRALSNTSISSASVEVDVNGAEFSGGNSSTGAGQSTSTSTSSTGTAGANTDTNSPAPDTAALEEPLRAWAHERRTRALTVIRMVKDLQKILWVSSETRWLLGTIPYNTAWLRNVFLRTVTTFQWWRANAAYRVSGLGNP